VCGGRATYIGREVAEAVSDHAFLWNWCGEGEDRVAARGELILSTAPPARAAVGRVASLACRTAMGLTAHSLDAPLAGDGAERWVSDRQTHVRSTQAFGGI